MRTFQSIVDEGFKESSQYDKINYQMHRAYDLLSVHDFFKILPVDVQARFCVTVMLISTQSSTAVVRLFSLSPSNSPLHYNLLEGYKS